MSKYSPIIVVIAYNRSQSFARLLNSLQNSHYRNSATLVISLEGGAPEEVIKIAENFQWRHGTKEVIQHQKRLGLKAHVLSCGDLTEKYNSAIILEDDIVVSPWHYEYAVAALEHYDDCELISGIALYRFHRETITKYPFYPINDGSDVYFHQLPCSWGQVWSQKQWESFRNWLNLHDNEASSNPNLPETIREWPKSSWLKEFCNYNITTGKYFVYPRESYSTNCGDMGTHHKTSSNEWQVPLTIKWKAPVFTSITESVAKYDIYCEWDKVLAAQYMGVSSEDLIVDLYGRKPLMGLEDSYIITSRKSNDALKSYSKSFKPHEMNLMLDIRGDVLSYCKVRSITAKYKQNTETYYYFGEIPYKYLIKEIYSRVTKKIISMFSN